MIIRAQAQPIPHKDKYRLHFSYEGRQYKRFLISNKANAVILQRRVNFYVEEFKSGILPLPPDTKLADFIFNKAINKEQREKSCVFFSKFLEEYLDLFLTTKAESTQKTEQIHIRHLKRFMESKRFNDYLLSSFDVLFFEQYKSYRKTQNVRNDTINKELTTFHIMFEKAVKLRYISENILKDVDRLKKESNLERFRTLQEIKELLEQEDYPPEKIKEIKKFRYLVPSEIKELLQLFKHHWLYPIIATLSWTGLRRCELLKLEWCDIDLKRGFLWARSRKQSPKQKEVLRKIPIHNDLREILIEHKLSKKSRWVFCKENGEQISKHTLHHTLNRLTKNTKFEGLGVHSLRHSLASNLASQGVDQRVIDDILGHQTEEMRKRYQHLTPDSKTDALVGLDYLAG